MECEKIQELMSAYLEMTLPPAEREGMDKHLRSCPACAASLADLEKTLHYLHSLEEIVPPAWLTQQVMRRVKKEAERSKTGLWKKLFSPLHIKLPLEAAGIFLIAVAALYVFKSIEPEIKTVMAPSKETMTEYAVKGKDRSSVTEAPQPPKPPTAKRAMKDETTAVVPSLQKSRSIPAAPSEPLLYDKEQVVKEKPAEELEVAEKEIRRGAAPPSAGIELKREAAPRAMSRPPEREDVSLSFNAADITAARDDITKILSDLGGRHVKEETSTGSIIIRGELDSEKLPLFIEELRLRGHGEQKLLPQAADKDRVLIKITVSAP